MEISGIWFPPTNKLGGKVTISCYSNAVLDTFGIIIREWAPLWMMFTCTNKTRVTTFCSNNTYAKFSTIFLGPSKDIHHLLQVDGLVVYTEYEKKIAYWHGDLVACKRLNSWLFNIILIVKFISVLTKSKDRGTGTLMICNIFFIDLFV